MVERHMKMIISDENVRYYKNDVQKEIIIQRLRDKGCRMTRQREVLLSIILDQDCDSCKEMYYKAHAIDTSISMATVYRMVSLLEEIGGFSRNNLYKISCGMECNKENACVIEFEDNTYCQLSAKAWYEVIMMGLKVCGYGEGKRIKSIEVERCGGNCLK